jgi:hypothetical protein
MGQFRILSGKKIVLVHMVKGEQGIQQLPCEATEASSIGPAASVNAYSHVCQFLIIFSRPLPFDGAKGR